MKAAYFLLLAIVGLTLVSCIRLDPEVTSQDCTVVATPAGFTRIFIGMPASGSKQSGTSFDDPLDGSSADKFDAILRTISEGQQPTWGTQANIPPQNLIVCLASGTFQTNGQYDWKIGLGHTQGSELGFTAEKNWKIQGRGVNHTTLQLASYLPDQFVDQNGVPLNGGRNIVIGTHSAGSSGIEISDLTIDANHDKLTAPGGIPLNLEGIILRSDQGGHWIHNVNVGGGSGDVGVTNEAFETFAVQIWGNVEPLDPQQNTGNLVEHVTVSKPGLAVVSGSRAGGAMDGIVVNNAVAEVRNNVVDGYQLGYGGWAMGQVNFHDNIARNVQYGFNDDSFTSNGVILQSNQFIRPSSYGIVIGGGGPNVDFSNWSVTGNSIELGNNESTAVVLRGQVQNLVFANNTITSDGGFNQIAIWSYPAVAGVANLNNTFQSNTIDKTLTMNFTQDPNFNNNCRFQNRDQQGKALADFPDNTSAQCH
ncbi:MAG TPA: hypothetical protein VFB76_08270 [Candidatus Angelobacter sp.]|nr:hypothetical protein [Candidatus Angelobacter sp.]